MQRSRRTRTPPIIAMVAMMILQFVSALHAADPVFIRRSGFEQLRQGAATDGGQNLYVSRRGRVQTINRLNFNLDGEIDLLFTQIAPQLQGVAQQRKTTVFSNFAG